MSDLNFFLAQGIPKSLQMTRGTFIDSNFRYFEKILTNLIVLKFSAIKKNHGNKLNVFLHFAENLTE